MKQEIRRVLEDSKKEQELEDPDQEDGKENFWTPLFFNNRKEENTEEKRKAENFRIQSAKLEDAFKKLQEKMIKDYKKKQDKTEEKKKETFQSNFGSSDSNLSRF